MSNHDKAAINLAIQSLQKGIDKLLQRAAPKKPHLDANRGRKRVHRLVRHTRHLLTQLLEKRQSLQALIEWLAQEWKSNRIQTRLADPQHTKTILAHALQCLVRCQDGLMLLTSGECRHPKDIQEAQMTPYPSQLTSLQERADGYTKLYSGTAYSGFGWDEYANETVGIQARLVQTLRPFHKDPWEYLEGPTQLLETLLDRQEEVVKNLKQSLQAIKTQMITDITKRLAKPIVFSTQDKMERIQVLVPARGSTKEQKISVVRLANNFQILGTSVLPNDCQTPSQWNRMLALPLLDSSSICDASTGASTLQASSVTVGAGNRKRRRVILEDSDSSEDEDETTRKSKESSTSKKNNLNTEASYSTGLEIRVETSKKKAETEDSLKAIKTQMGADVRGLEMARQDLEHEESTSRSIAQKEDDAPWTHQEDEERVHRLTKVLRRAEQRPLMDRDDNEIWDARECLRQAYMELGNQALWSFRSTKNLERARSSFEQVKTLVVQQQESHQISVTRTNDQRSMESRMISRNLIFLLAQATTNIGIALVESTGAQLQQQQQQQAAIKKHLAASIQELRRARVLLSKMREEATCDLSKCPVHTEQWVNLKADILEADKLESLACRWLGIALWTTTAGASNDRSAVSRAEKVLQEAWSLFRGFRVACLSQLLPQLLDVAAEAIFATSTAADLGCSELENLDSRTCKKELGEMYLSIVTRALKKQVEILRAIDDLKLLVSDDFTVDTVSTYQLDNDIPSAKSIQQILENIEKWWRTKEDGFVQSANQLYGKTIATQLQRISSSRSDIGFNRVGPPNLFAFAGFGRRNDTAQAASHPFVVIGGGSSSSRLPRFGNKNTAGITSVGGSGGGHRRSGTTTIAGGRQQGSGARCDMACHSLNNRQHTNIIDQRPTRFRKWGDELISNSGMVGERSDRERRSLSEGRFSGENQDGGVENSTPLLLSKLSYPTAAPPIPAELRRFLFQSHGGPSRC